MVLLAVGVEAFARRDVGVTIAVPAPGCHARSSGSMGRSSRSFGDLLPTALAWGIGLGVYGVLMVAASRSLLDALTASPAMAEIFRNLIPGIDITTAAGFLQLAFADIGFVLIGLAAATFIAARSSDETSGRLELQLATPLTRARWAAASGMAVWLAIALVTALLAAAVALGVASLGQDPLAPAASGTLVLAVYGAAVAGIGVAVAGVSRASFAMPAVLAVAIGTFLVDLLAPVLRLPDWVGQLALTAHLGRADGRHVGRGRDRRLPRARGRRARRRGLGHGRRDVGRMKEVDSDDGPIGRRRGAGCSSSTGSRPSRPAGGRTSGGSSASSAPSTSSRQPPSCPTGRSSAASSTGSGSGSGAPAARRHSSRPRRRAETWEEELVARFNAARDAEYDEIVDSVERFEDEIRRETRKKRFRFAELEEGETDWEKLQRWFARLTERDFFGAPGRAGAEDALARGRALLDEFTREVYRAEGLDADEAGGPGGR